jgi:D-3-phosphoglycerate dehydrogenase / 2-oxoglutarate reductase
MKIFIGPSTFAVFDKTPLKMLEKNGIEYELNTYGKALGEDQIFQKISNLDGIVAGLEPLNKRVLNNAKKLKVISRVGVGLDTIDLEEAERRKINVENTPDGPTEAVAELTIGLIIDLLRKICVHDRKVKEGLWIKMSGNLLNKKIVGIIGFGRIGRRLSELLEPFQVSIIFYDPYVAKGTENSVKVELDYLLKSSDIVTLHLPYTEETNGILSNGKLALMKKTAFLINVSRGGLVDEEALYCFLKEGKLAGAAMDTFVQEPYHGDLCQCENVTITPHVGSFTQESRQQMEIEAVQNLLKHLPLSGK